MQTAEHPLELANVEGNVDFQHVSFGYQPEQCVIHDFSAKVKSGQKIAIVGPTGAGKTTIVNLLTRFYDVNRGNIFIDGKNIKDIEKQIIKLKSDTDRLDDRYGKVMKNLSTLEKSLKELETSKNKISKTINQAYDGAIEEE